MSEISQLTVADQSHLREATKVRLKAQMLCSGVAAPEAFRDKLTHDFHLQKGFIHGTVFMLDGTDPVNTAFLDSMSGPEGAVTLHDGDTPYVELDGYRFSCSPIYQSSVFNSTINGIVVDDYFTLHSPHTLFTAPIRQCIFITIGKPCTFCTFEGGKIVRLNPSQFETILVSLLQSVPEVKAIAIGGGTPNLSDHGAQYYSQLAAIAKRLGLATSVEMVPPTNLADLDRLFAAGIDSLIMSIELWDDDVRQRVCLGKGALTKSHYMQAWQIGVESLGRGNVTSVLLAGLEPIESTLAGAADMIKRGIIPALIPFRPYEGIPIADVRPMRYQDYLRISAECGRMLRLAGLDPREQLGCTECGGCSLEIRGFLDEILPSGRPTSE
jgi:hypothetical protein